jgi:L-aminopeptidase/D-esterase-like protein
MIERTPVERARARELGIILGAMSPGPLNAITDVAGVRVGHATIVRGSGPLVRGVGPVCTGVTALLPHGENIFTAKVPAAAAVFNGFGKTIPLTHTVTVLNEQNPAIDALFAAVVEATEEGVINALFAAHSTDGRDDYRVEALPVDATMAILRRYGVGVCI